MVKKYINTTITRALEKDLKCACGSRKPVSCRQVVRGGCTDVGRSCNTRCAWVQLTAHLVTEGARMLPRCVHSVDFYTACFSRQQFSAFTSCFLWTKSCIIKGKIIMLKSFPNISIALEQICIFKTSFLAELTVPNLCDCYEGQMR